MHDIKQLERDWKIYQSKKRRPLFIILLVIICMSLLYLFLGNIKIDSSKIIESFDHLKKKTLISDTKYKSILLNTGLQNLEEKETLISNSLTKIKAENILVDIPVLDITNEEESKLDIVDNVKGKVYLDIVETSSVNAYQDVEQRFYQSHDIDDALFLAKSYYKRLNYEKAVVWAVEVNKLDKNVEESVFIFVKAKVKLGQKNEAITLLKNYLKKSNSSAGKTLLNKIENDSL